jgi:hypothetical protein
MGPFTIAKADWGQEGCTEHKWRDQLLWYFPQKNLFMGPNIPLPPQKTILS